MEDTLCDTWKHINHRIDAILLRCVRVIKYAAAKIRKQSSSTENINKLPINSLPTVVAKLSVEELVHQNHLNDDVDETEQFTEPVTNRVQFMALKVTQ